MRERKAFLAYFSLLLAMLACNMPGSSPSGDTGSGGGAPGQPSPGVTVVVVVENTNTPLPADTPVPASATPSLPPELTLTKNSNCRIGPSTFYNVIDQIAANKVLPVVGRSEDSTWWQVVNDTGHECWIFNENSTPNQDFSSLPIGDAPPLPGTPVSFFVVDQQCLSAQKKFSVTLSWASGGGEDGFRIYRDGNRTQELKPTKFNFKDASAPYNKAITYEIEAFNENGTSQRAVQIVPPCK